jgi:hypothetical protein
MSVRASHTSGDRPRLRLVSSSLVPVIPAGTECGWRRLATAIVSSTWDIARHLRDQRWSLVNEGLTERRELLGLMSSLQLDAQGRDCLRALTDAALESERAIAAMMGKSR